MTDVFVRDRVNGTTERVSVSSNGAEGNGESSADRGGTVLAISPDGRFVAFSSKASNLVVPDTNGTSSDVYVRDRVNGTTERVSVSSSGAQGDDHSGLQGMAISADGRFVAFASNARNLILPDTDTNQSTDIFVHDRVDRKTERVNLGPGGAEADRPSGFTGIAISADGNFVAFASDASNLIPPGTDTNQSTDIFVRDRVVRKTDRVSVSSSGAQGNSRSGFQYVAISADGNFVAFSSDASTLVVPDDNSESDVFVRDRVNGTTERVSVDPGGVEGDGFSETPSISADGTFVAFASRASNLVD